MILIVFVGLIFAQQPKSLRQVVRDWPADYDETGVLFELISDRYEKKSLIITCNHPFSDWDTIFKDKTMAVAAIDRLVHHSKILQINCESYRRSEALKRSKEMGSVNIKHTGGES